MLRAWGPRFRVRAWGSGFKVWGLKFTVERLGSVVQDLGHTGLGLSVSVLGLSSGCTCPCNLLVAPLLLGYLKNPPVHFFKTSFVRKPA